MLKSSHLNKIAVSGIEHPVDKFSFMYKNAAVETVLLRDFYVVQNAFDWFHWSTVYTKLRVSFSKLLCFAVYLYFRVLHGIAVPLFIASL